MGPGELLVGKKCVAPAFTIVRSGFELFRLCCSRYIMGIISCELSEPLSMFLFQFTVSVVSAKSTCNCPAVASSIFQEW